MHRFYRHWECHSKIVSLQFYRISVGIFIGAILSAYPQRIKISNRCKTSLKIRTEWCGCADEWILYPTKQINEVLMVRWFVSLGTITSIKAPDFVCWQKRCAIHPHDSLTHKKDDESFCHWTMKCPFFCCCSCCRRHRRCCCSFSKYSLEYA